MPVRLGGSRSMAEDYSCVNVYFSNPADENWGFFHRGASWPVNRRGARDERGYVYNP
jgi:hypothetical protein